MLRATKSKTESVTPDKDTITDTNTEKGTSFTELKGSYLVLAALFITFITNQWSRQAIYYLCNFSENSNAFKHIDVALNFSKENYATLASFGFTLVFAIVSLFAGGFSDKYNRKWIIVAACVSWSILTGLHAFAGSYADLLPLRALTGASQAFFNPAAYTLLADIFPPSMVGSVNGFFSSAIYLGGACASLSILIDEKIGWQGTMLATGGAGLIAAALTAVVVTDEKSKKKKDSEDNSNVDIPQQETGKNDVFTGLKEVLMPLDAQLLYSATVLRFIAGFSIAIWKAPFIFGKFPEASSAFAGSNAAVIAVGGLTSSLLGGYISDKLSESGSISFLNLPKSRSWVPAIGSLLAAPLWAGFVLADVPEAAAIFLFFEYLTAECWFGPTLASLYKVVPKNRRGVAQGIFSVLTAAGNFGPVLISSLAAYAAENDISGVDSMSSNTYLGDVLIAVVSGAYMLSAILFTIVAYRDDKRIEEEVNQ